MSDKLPSDELLRLRAIRDAASALLELPGRASEPKRESAHWNLEEALRVDLYARESEPAEEPPAYPYGIRLPQITEQPAESAPAEPASDENGICLKHGKYACLKCNRARPAAEQPTKRTKLPGRSWRIGANRDDGTKLDIENDGVLDEVCLEDVLHLEQMDNHNWWMRLGELTCNIYIPGKKNKSQVTIEEIDSGVVAKLVRDHERARKRKHEL